jgi:hypothetical protein
MSLNQNEQKALVSTLPEDLRLIEESYFSEEDFLNALTPKVAYMMQYNSGVFFQLLYKMDVLERCNKLMCLWLLLGLFWKDKWRRLFREENFHLQSLKMKTFPGNRVLR